MTKRSARARRGRVVLVRRSRWKRARSAAFRLLALSVLGGLGTAIWFVSGDDLPVRVARPIVNDVTQLNPVPVARIAYPRSVAELQWLVRSWPGPIAIGGGHFSMGGQTACEGCLSLDMRKLDHVLALDVAKRSVLVEAGITWHKLQAAIDAHGLAVSIMQTYANFSVGGALSVNAHGRYIGGGPVIHSVQEIELVLADGRLVRASPHENSELFYGAIGGYGGIGVIVSARLALAENTRIERNVVGMPLSAYPAFFAANLRNSRRAVFHNADLYPPAYDYVRAQTWSTTDRLLTDRAHFIQPALPSRTARMLLYWLTDLPLGHSVRRYVYDPLLYARDAVVWRNHEASYDVSELEPASRRDSTYVLQEYFVPTTRLAEFVPKLRDVLTRHAVRAVNISIRHARADPGSLLAWARTEVFCFVLYYKQGTSLAARHEVGVWTREAIDAVLSVSGTYYLPYQPHATLAQLRRGYPNFDAYVALKNRVDPHYRFRNKLWDKYLPPQDAEARARRKLQSATTALRAEGQTFLTLPEWYIVFSAAEYAKQLETARPSAFPYLASIRQFWSLYRGVYHRTRHRYPSNPEYHVMNTVIGLSFSLENLIKGAYENTIGRASEWFACPGAWQLCSAEDRYAAETARAYDTFIRTYPWYEFPYSRKLRALWQLDSSANHSWLRTAERRLFLSLEYGAKTLYAAAIRASSQSAFGVEPLTTLSWIRRPDSAPLPTGSKTLARFGDEEVAWLPRYEGFRDALLTLTKAGGELRQVAGNDFIAVTWLVPRDFQFEPKDGEVTLRWPMLTEPTRQRALLFTPVSELAGCVRRLQARGASLDHVFDY
jgi:FAD/FMN-containing dehydrogenase